MTHQTYTLSLIKNDGSFLPVASAEYDIDRYNSKYPYPAKLLEIKIEHSSAPKTVNEFHRQLADLIITQYAEDAWQKPRSTLISSGDIAGAIVDMVILTRHRLDRIYLVVQVSQRGVRRLGYYLSPGVQPLRDTSMFDAMKRRFEEINYRLSVDPGLPFVIRNAIDAEPVYGIEGRPGRRKEMELTNTVTEGVPKRTFPSETNYEESESDTEMQPLPPTASEDETSPESED